jgi:perosamine synthetase
VVIEDACHALGASYKGKTVGCISDMTVFSFHPVKHITTGEGGMVATDNEEMAAKLRLLHSHGIKGDARERQAKGDWYYEMVDLGYNYRLTDIACALGLSQLRRLDKNLSRRHEIARRYSSAFADLESIILPVERDYVSSAWHLFPIRLDLKRLEKGRAAIFSALRAENIGVNVHYIPVHTHPYYRKRFGYKGGEYPHAEEAYDSLISLPMFHGMTDEDVEDVIKAVTKVVENYAARV